MKKILSLLLALVTLHFALVTSQAQSADVDYGIKVKNPLLELPVDKSTIMQDGALVYEAENMIYDSTINVLEDETASGGAYLKTTGDGITEASALSNPTIMLNFVVSESNRYYFWVRMRTYNATTNSSIHYSLNGSSYQTLWGFAETGNPWQWRLLGSETLTAGNAKIEFKKRLSGFQLDKLIITSNTAYSVEGSADLDNFSVSSTNDTTLFDAPPFYPTESHPRLIITKDYLPTFKQNLTSDELAPMFKNCLSLADETLNCDMGGTKYDDTVLNKLKARAIAFVSGYRDATHARQTIEYYKEYLSTCYYSPTVSDVTRNIGDCMFTGALIYDWCYDQMSAAEREYFIKRFKELAAGKEIGWPPTKLPCNISGHSGEQEIFQDLLSVGIAVYDEDTEVYDLAAGRLFEYMQPSREYFNKTGAHPVTLEYSFWRHSNEAVADLICTRMGHPNIFGEDMYRPAIKNIYARLAMGKWFKNGDAFQYAYNTSFDYDTYDYQEVAILGNLYKEPHLRAMYLRDMAIKGNQFNFWAMVSADPSAPVASDAELPLAYKSTYPLTSITARTSWKHGINSDSAAVYMEGREKILADHQHMKLGDFSIYYKGNLILDSGTYNGSSGGFGSEHDINYYKRTISGNCVTVYDPNEEFYYSANSYGDDGYYKKTGTKVSNDGGQIFHVNVCELPQFLAMDDFAKTEGTYIGPNEQTPEFSFLKTDLTNAYSDKVKNYTRSMVWMDLDDDEYPAAFVVFDNVESSDKSFKKTWRIHCQEEPTISNDITTITRTEDGFNGKLVNKTLLPTSFSLTKVGGSGSEYMVDGKNYPNEPKSGVKNDGAPWAIELSPNTAETNTKFLNAMYVTDAGTVATLEADKVETSTHVGAAIKDRLVMFSKTGNDVSGAFAIKLPDAEDEVKCLITDVKPGVWSVKATDGTSVLYEVSDEEHSLYFRGTPNTSYIIEPSSGTPTEVSYPAMDKGAISDFELYDGKRLIYDPVGTKLVNGVPYIPAASILRQYGIGVAYSSTDGSVDISNQVYTINVKAGSSVASINGTATTLSHPVLEFNDATYICLLDFKQLASTSYNAYAKQLKISIPDYSTFKGISLENSLDIAYVTSSGDDGNVAENTFDLNPETRWSCSGDGSWICYDLGAVEEVSSADIYWHNGNARSETFEILVSDDNQTFTNVYEGKSDGVTNGFEQVPINASTRYIKIICHGNTQGLWNSIREVLFIK